MDSDPSEIEELLARAKSALKDGEVDTALETLTEVIRCSPECAEAYFSRSLAWVRKGEHEKAAEDLDRYGELTR